MQRNTGANAKGAKVTQKSQKGMPKIIWEMLEPVFMRVAGHKWLGRRMGSGCRNFAGLLGLDEYGSERREIRGRTQKAQKLRRSRKRECQKLFGKC